MSRNDNMYHELRENLRKASSNGTNVNDAGEFSSSQKRTGTRRPTASNRARYQLVEVDGVLDWEEATDAPPIFQKRRRGLGSSSASGVIASIDFEKLAPSKLVEFLVGKDLWLTPVRGLRRFNPATNKLEPSAAPTAGEALLLIHGTFSNGDNFINSLLGTQHGQDFLRDMGIKYNHQIYTFDHATLSVSPILNAIELARLLGKSKAKFDVISHSRGGLVARWWCEAFDPESERCRKAILVGSPLAGTGLAAPPNLRGTIRLLSNVGNALGKITGMVSTAVPVLGIVETLLHVMSSITSWTAKTPIVDAVVGMVPGLFAQSRVGNNPELLQLRDFQTNPGRYFGVVSNFEPADPIWAFWRVFRKERLADAGADLIFNGPNDLVVDTPSMADLRDSVAIPNNQILDYKNSPIVHHLNYFDILDTVKFWREVL